MAAPEVVSRVGGGREGTCRRLRLLVSRCRETCDDGLFGKGPPRQGSAFRDRFSICCYPRYKAELCNLPPALGANRCQQESVENAGCGCISFLRYSSELVL